MPEDAKCPERELRGTGAAPGERRRTQRSGGKLIRRLDRRKIQRVRAESEERDGNHGGGEAIGEI